MNEKRLPFTPKNEQESNGSIRLTHRGRVAVGLAGGLLVAGGALGYNLSTAKPEVSTTTITFTAETGDTISGKLSELCPDASAAKILEMQKEFGQQSGAANPSNPQIHEGGTYTVSVPTEDCQPGK